MKKTYGLLISVFGMCLFSLAAEADLFTRVREESATTLAYPCVSRDCPQQEEIASYQYIYVEGFLADYRLKEYNAASRVLQRRFNIKDEFVLIPESKRSIPANADILYHQILNLRAQSPHRKAILIAFSKGGAETLLMVLQHPEFFTQGLISELVIVNGALRGTPLADLWSERCVAKHSPSILSLTQPSDKSLCAILRDWQGGVTSMSPRYIIPVLNRALANLSPNDRQFLSRRIWAVQSQWGDLKVERTSNLWPTHLFLNRFGANDGVILTEGQMLPEGFGTNLGVFKFDHTSLLRDSTKPDLARRNEAFSRALIREIVISSQRSD